MSFSKEYAQMVKEQQELLPFIHPLLCGTEFYPVKKQEKRCLSEYDSLLKIAEEKNWQNLPAILEPLHNPAIAIVVTDEQEIIEWVNEGFFHMTGYPSAEVLGKNPKFLQGQETSLHDVRQIRQSVNQYTPFTSVILNYRKNGEPYNCEIKVYPIFNGNRKLVNFLAIEKEVIAMGV